MGELEKRLHNCYSNDYHVYLAKTRELIKSMKQEFPKPAEFNYPTYVEAKDWFIKWFGDFED